MLPSTTVDDIGNLGANQQRKPGRQPGQKVYRPKALSDQDNTNLINICIGRGQEKFATQTKLYFWNRVSDQFQKYTGIQYKSTQRQVDKLIKWRKSLKKGEGSGHTSREDDLTQAIDEWSEIVENIKYEQGLRLSQKEQKKRYYCTHDQRRDNLS